MIDWITENAEGPNSTWVAILLILAGSLLVLAPMLIANILKKKNIGFLNKEITPLQQGLIIAIISIAALAVGSIVINNQAADLCESFDQSADCIDDVLEQQGVPSIRNE